MKRLWASPVLLLLLTGLLLGLSLPLGKLASAAGLSPILWAFVVSSGAAAVLFPALALTSGLRRPDRHRLRYFVITATVSYALPNLLLFSVIPKVGAGYAGIMFTLSPVITLLLSLALGIRRPNRLGMAGIATGFAGALVVALSRGGLSQPAAAVWVLAALLIPVCLGAGNIYRTVDWPTGAGPIELSVGSNGAAAVLLLAASLLFTGGLPLTSLLSVPLLTLAQVAAAAGMFAIYFRLQEVGGPVYLSQIGYVAAAVGLLFGTLLFGEHYGLVTWLGAALIVVGVTLTTLAQRG